MKQELWNLLEQEYGIRTMEDFRRAVREQKKVDLAVFCEKERVNGKIIKAERITI